MLDLEEAESRKCELSLSPKLNDELVDPIALMDRNTCLFSGEGNDDCKVDGRCVSLEPLIWT